MPRSSTSFSTAPDTSAIGRPLWTNLTIGRKQVRFVNRTGMERFFREAFAQNRPWNEVVRELVGAEGRSDENGAVNYLLAQMVNNDEAVQATAKTTRLFMGVQVQCTQCHNHPFNEWKQDQFWQINSFLRQTRRINHRKFDSASGRQVDDYAELVSGNFSGPVYFEKRSGEMQVAYPIFNDAKVDPGSETNRRRELARLMTSGDNPLIARAMVNRTWAHFMGCGFTTPVDDMGPHKPPSHPELLDRLSQEFVKNGYDVRRLIRWICDSEAYNLTSRAGKKNTVDDPTRGHVPLFSRMYPKPLEAEQLYDSLLMATRAENSGETNWAEAQKQRDAWLQQFIIAFGTDEVDEANTFTGTIPQALLMMNGPLVQKATSAEKGSFLCSVLESDGDETRKIQQLYLSALSRHARGHEESAATELAGIRTRQSGRVPRSVLGPAEFQRIHYQPLRLTTNPLPGQRYEPSSPHRHDTPALSESRDDDGGRRAGARFSAAPAGQCGHRAEEPEGVHPGLAWRRASHDRHVGSQAGLEKRRRVQADRHLELVPNLRAHAQGRENRVEALDRPFDEHP